MSVPANDRLQEWSRVRRVAFFAWVAILSMLFGITFVGVTASRSGCGSCIRILKTNPVTDLGFFALGTVIITTGFVVQLLAREHKIAGVQQAVIGLLAPGVAGLIGRRVEPLIGSLLTLVATAILVALHPARREFFKIGTLPSPRLAVLSIIASIPATVYAAAMLLQARWAILLPREVRVRGSLRGVGRCSSCPYKRRTYMRFYNPAISSSLAPCPDIREQRRPANILVMNIIER